MGKQKYELKEVTLRMDYQKRDQSVAKTLLTVSASIGIVIVMSFVMAIVLEIPTGRGMPYVLFGLIGLIGFFFAPLPCLILSLVGTFKAWKAGAKHLIVPGIIGIICWAIFLAFATVAYMIGMSI